MSKFNKKISVYIQLAKIGRKCSEKTIPYFIITNIVELGGIVRENLKKRILQYRLDRG